MRKARLVIGNSSSDVIEASILNTPTINIGNRQEGRYMSESVINKISAAVNILSAINKALKLIINNNLYPFGKGKISYKIINELKKFIKSDKKVPKKFNDIN